MKIVLTTILMKNGKRLKHESRETKSSLQKRTKAQKHLKINGTMMNANLQ